MLLSRFRLFSHSHQRMPIHSNRFLIGQELANFPVHGTFSPKKENGFFMTVHQAISPPMIISEAVLWKRISVSLLQQFPLPREIKSKVFPKYQADPLCRPKMDHQKNFFFHNELEPKAPDQPPLTSIASCQRKETMPHFVSFQGKC